MDLLDAWNQFGWSTKVGLLAQSATVGLLAAAMRKPSRTLVALAWVGAVLGLIGTSLTDVVLVEYERCGTLDRPAWCD